MEISLKRVLSSAAILLMLIAVMTLFGAYAVSAAADAEAEAYAVAAGESVAEETVAAETEAYVLAAGESVAEETAAEEKDDGTTGKAIAAGIAIGLAAAAGAIGMGIAIAKSNEGIARQPEADGKIRTNMMMGLVFVETSVIFSFVVAILIIFVL